MFEALREYLLESPEPHEYDALAQRLQLRRNTLAVAIHRLRTRPREVVQDELSHTVAGDAAFVSDSRTLSRILRNCVTFLPAQSAPDTTQRAPSHQSR